MRHEIDDHKAWAETRLRPAEWAVGRPVRERCLLEGLVAVEGGGTTALVGEAGAGKTALLAHAAEVAPKRAGLAAPMNGLLRNRDHHGADLPVAAGHRVTVCVLEPLPVAASREINRPPARASSQWPLTAGNRGAPPKSPAGLVSATVVAALLLLTEGAGWQRPRQRRGPLWPVS